MRALALTLSTIFVLSTSGCVSIRTTERPAAAEEKTSATTNRPATADARLGAEAQYGRVTRIERVTLSDAKPGIAAATVVGAALGAAVAGPAGAVAGASAGGKAGATAAGAATGAVAGHHMAATSDDGGRMEVEIRLDNGRVVVYLTQVTNALRVQDRVAVRGNEIHVL